MARTLKPEVFSDSTNKMSSSVFSYTYKVPADAPGGEYRIQIGGRNIPCNFKAIRIRDYDRQELVVTTEWDRDTYYPGDLVTGTIAVKAADGNAFDKAPTISYKIDFGDFAVPLSESGKLDLATSTYRISFNVPETTDVQFATCAIVVKAGQVTQSASKILVVGQPQNLYIEFFPETSFIVFGVMNKIYF